MTNKSGGKLTQYDMDTNYTGMASTEQPHYLTTEDKKNLSSKALGGTALGFGIAGTALGLLNGGLGIFNKMGSSSSDSATNKQDAENKYLERKQNAEYIQITKDYYQNKLDSLRELTESFYTLDQKIQVAKDVAATQSRENFDALNKRIIDLEKSDAVMKATQPLYQVINDLKLHNVDKDAQTGIAGANMNAKHMVDGLAMQTRSWIDFESERRRCGDNTIVNYANSTFYPKLVADVSTASTTTQQPIYNPLMPPAPLI